MRPTLELGKPRRCLPVLLSALLASGSLTPALALAQQNKPQTTKAAKAAKAEEEAKRDQARKHYADGEERLKAGDHAGAYEAYKAANDTIPAPITVFKMAVCQDEMGKIKEAVLGYEAFLADNPEGSLPDRVTEAETRLEELKKKLPATVVLKSDPAGAAVEVDGVAQEGTTPIELEVSPGHHTLRLSLSGYETSEQEIEAQAGASHDLALTLSPEAPTPVAEAPPPVAAPVASADAGEGTNIVPYVLLGLAGAGAVVGGVFGVKAMQGKSDFDKGDRSSSKADEIDRSALVADMAFGAALTFGITGLVLLLTDDGSSPVEVGKSRNLQVAPYVSPQGAGAGAFVQF